MACMLFGTGMVARNSRGYKDLEAYYMKRKTLVHVVVVRSEDIKYVGNRLNWNLQISPEAQTCRTR